MRWLDFAAQSGRGQGMDAGSVLRSLACAALLSGAAWSGPARAEGTFDMPAGAHFNPQKLERISEFFRKEVADGKIPGANVLISQHGKRAGWAHNITASPKVRVRVDDEWHDGTATFVPGDDVVARARSFGGKSKVSQSATLLGMRALQSDPISVRITYTD